MKIILFPMLGFLVALNTAGRHRTDREHMSAEEPLSRSLFGVSPLPQPALAAFRAVMTASATPGGEVSLAVCGSQPHKLVRVQGKTLGDALESIVQGDPVYHWKVRGGVVNLLPKAGVPPLLKTRLTNFDSGDATSGASAVVQLFALREVSQAAARLGLTQAVESSGLGALGPGGVPMNKKPLGVQLSHATVLEVLNAIVRRAGRGVWHYTETHCEGSRSFHVAFSQ